MSIETALAVKKEVQEFSIDWGYYSKAFIFSQQGINSKATVHSYRYALKNFIRFMGESRITRPTPADIYSYEGWLRSKQYSDFTKNLYLGIVQRYFAYLENHIDLETGEKVHIYPDITKAVNIKIKCPPRVPVRNSLTVRDVKRIRQYMRSLEGQKAERDLLMIELCLFNGLRDCEVARIRVEDFVQDEGRIRLYLFRKGRSSRISHDFTFVQEKLYRNLLRYIRKYRIKKFVFTDINHKHPKTEHLTPVSISAIISSRMKEAGVKRDNCTPHSMRHHFATALLRKNVSVFDVQRAMGHSNLQSTLVYLHTKNLFDDNPAELKLEY
jgi:integrase